MMNTSEKNPYIVVPKQVKDFLDFKGLSVNMGVLKERYTEQGDDAVDWMKVVAFRVTLEEEKKIMFKTNHMRRSIGVLS